jgi:hypothetical protein
MSKEQLKILATTSWTRVLTLSLVAIAIQLARISWYVSGFGNAHDLTFDLLGFPAHLSAPGSTTAMTHGLIASNILNRVERSWI